MNRAMALTAAVLMATLLAGCQSTPAPQLGPWVKNIIGIYTGPITLGTGDVVAGTTTFALAPDGALTGEYELLLEKRADAPGTLQSFDLVDTHTLRCRWRDKYGAGELQMVFSPDRKSFEGLWRYDGQTLRRPWNGAR
jgi:hypothetical protein